MTKTRKTKSPEERLAEAKKAAAKAKSDMARANLADNPEFQKMQEALDNVNKEIAANSRKMKGHNSFENRRNAIQARLDWVIKEEELTNAKEAHAQSLRTYLQEAMSNADEKVSFSKVMKNAPKSDLAKLEKEYDAANAHWRSLTPQALKAAADAEKSTKTEEASA